ncbi:hypothetical protein Tco_0188791 [Tanacetum coccineum]
MLLSILASPNLSLLVLWIYMSQFPRDLKMIIIQSKMMLRWCIRIMRRKEEKRKQDVGESSSPKKYLKIRIKQQKPTPTTPLPPSDDQERDYIIEATQLSLALDKSTKVYKEQHNVLEEDVEKLVEREEESSGSDFLLICYTLVMKVLVIVTGSSVIRTEKRQTPIPSPPRFRRTDLSSNRAINEELMVYVTPTPNAPPQDQSKPTSSRRTNLLGSISKMSRRRGQLRKHMNNTFVTNRYFQGKMEEMCEARRKKFLELTISTTNDLVKETLEKMVTDAVNQERDSYKAVVPALISKEFAAHAPKIIEELFRIYMQIIILNLHLTIIADPELCDVKAKFEKSSASASSCKNDAFHKRDHDDHQGEDAPPKGEKNAKRQKTSKRSKSTRVIDEDEATIKDMLSNQFKDAEEYAYHLEQAQNNMENQIIWKSRREDLKRPNLDALVFYGPQRNPNEPLRDQYTVSIMEDMTYLCLHSPKTTKERRAIRCIQKKSIRRIEDIVCEYSGRDQTWSLLQETPIRQEKRYVLSLYKIHAISFAEEDLEEKMIGWVSRVFKTFNEEARLSIQHWKDTWHKRMYKIKHRKVRDDPEEVFLNHGIVEIVKVPTDQQYGLIFMKRIVVMRENAKQVAFLSCLIMECLVSWLQRNTFIGYAVTGLISISRGLIQAIPTSLPPQPIGEVTKASNLQRIPPGV